MAKEAVEAVPAAKQLFERASDILGYNLLDVCAEGAPRWQGGGQVSHTRLAGGATTVAAVAAVATCRMLAGWVPALGSGQDPAAVLFATAPTPSCTTPPSLLPPGPKEKLDLTAVSQPAIYVASLAALEKLKAEQVGGLWQGGSRLR